MNAELAFDRQTLAKTEITISPMGLGAWQWGDRAFWEYGRTHQAQDLFGALDASLEAGVNFIDTAEVYGFGRSESLLGEALRQVNRQVLVASKFFPYPWRLWKGWMRRALRHSLERTRLQRFDLYQIHWPTPPLPVETWVRALADALDSGLIRAAGVSNYDLDQTRRARLILEARGYALACNQVHYSLLNRKIERNGVLSYCLSQGITVLAYSPLEQGLLTGKYDPAHPPAGVRRQRYGRVRLEAAQSIVQALSKVGQSHGGRTPSQVALNWLMCKGVVPIPGAKNERQAAENAGAMTWRLSEEAVRELDQASAAVS
jgi:aryl-alcohol dehydrogenase-like predicted oxidoreductase